MALKRLNKTFKYVKYILYCMWISIVNTGNDDGVEHAGYMSFMVLLSLFPFLVFFVSLAGLFGASEIGADFIKIIVDNLPEDAIAPIKERINEIGVTPPQRLLTLAIVGTVWTSSSFVEALRTILNRVYRVSSPPPYLWRRLLSIAQFIIISLAIFSTMMILVMVPIALNKIPYFAILLDRYSFIFVDLRYIIIFLSLFLAAASLYYVIPNVKLQAREVIPGALLTVILWMLSAKLLSSYIGYYTQLSLVYGSLGSIIVTLIFFYVANMIFIYGAELNHTLFRKVKVSYS